MKESQKRARQDVVATALKTLLANEGSGLTRKTFFLPTSSTPSEAEIEACKGRRWQKPVLDRLVDKGLLVVAKVGDDMGYGPGDRTLIRKVLRDYEDDGLLLASLVFPNEVRGVELPSVRDALEEEEALTRQHQVDDVLDKVTDTKAMDKMGKDLQEAIDKHGPGLVLADALTRFTLAVNEQHTTARESYNRLVLSMESMAKAYGDHTKRMEAMLSAQSARTGTVETKVGGYNKRLDALEKREQEHTAAIHRLVNILQEYHVREKTNGSGFDVSEVAEKMAAAVAVEVKPLLDANTENFSKVTALMYALQGSTETLAGHLKSKEADRLSDLNRRLEAHIKDGQELQELLSEVWLKMDGDKDGPATE